MIKIAIFEDNREQRDALSAVLNAADGLGVVGAYNSAHKVTEDVETCSPDLVLMDIDMPVVDGIKAVAILRARFKDLRIVMLTVIEDDDRIFAAIRAGADGYFLKQTDPERLIQGIREAMEGGAPMSPSVARRVLRMVDGARDTKQNNEDFKLSPRENEILALLVKGHTYKRIASDLNLSYATVNRHVSNVYVKLRVHSVNEAVALAVRKGWA
ncbi:MAG: response regulator transcription factor [Flavobacteriales bacterium]|nr:response regulator transcription factor [Flavobacteriales bacterium]